MSNNVKIIRKVPNDKHVAFIVENDSLLCDTCIDLFTEFDLNDDVVYAFKKWEQLFFNETSSKPVEKCWKVKRQLNKLFVKFIFVYVGGSEVALRMRVML